jgi:sarcosine oxidase subunit gamma
MSDTLTLAARLPVSSAATVTAADGIGVRALVRDGLGLATVLARKGAAEMLGRRVRERYALELPAGPRRSDSPQAAFAGTGPGAWLAISQSGGNEFAARLAGDLEGVASVSDQSDGYVVIRLSGARVRDALAKLIPLDLHPRAFRSGDVATTVASHISVTLWRLADEPSTAVFEVIMFRSLARSFWHALAEAAAEFGFSGTAP